jgi:hypothetical protein
MHVSAVTKLPSYNFPAAVWHGSSVFKQPECTVAMQHLQCRQNSIEIEE